MAYDIVLEETGNGFSAYVPELPGCVAAAESREETVALLLEAIEMHLEALSLAQNLAFGPVFGLGVTTGSVVALEQREFALAYAAPNHCEYLTKPS